MGRVAIRVEGVSKRYAIGTREPYRTLRDALTRPFSAAAHRFPGKSSKGISSSEEKYVWALKDTSFEVREGEVIGVIGRNGAGKSTLLRILSRITRPSVGYTETFGRVGSLLEVGTGFHPELTGRENVYLNGGILGMKKAEIDRKFDEIVGFAEVLRFIDTPIKHYSSGMYVRLAFAVAAHLEPEILLVDEVLAVGDAEFQKKCLGKMGEVGRSGRTVLLVSHQMNQIRRLCDRSIWLDRGRVKAVGPTTEVIAAYEAAVLDPGTATAPGGGCFQRWALADHGNVLKEPFHPFELRFRLLLKDPVSLGHFGVTVRNDANLVIAGWGFDRISLPAGAVQVSIRARALPIRPGSYSLTASLFDGGSNLTGGRVVEIWQAAPLLIVDSIPLAHPQDEWAGVLNIPGDVSIAPTPDAEWVD
jgi:ABC-type polysaccharide/polyol phosphate transport system ATPase subunit